MEQRPARLFVCARCRAQVLLCSQCDRGNRYCSRDCRREARDAARREASSRYQRSPRGRLAHAQRSRRWRGRRAAAACGVTHQGWQAGGRAAPLATCTDDLTQFTVTTQQASCEPMPDVTPIAAPPMTTPPVTAATWRCRGCAAPLPTWIRQGFLRRGRPLAPSPLAGWWRHDHIP